MGNADQLINGVGIRYLSLHLPAIEPITELIKVFLKKLTCDTVKCPQQKCLDNGKTISVELNIYINQ